MRPTQRYPMARTKEPHISQAILDALKQRQIDAPARPANTAKYPFMKGLLLEVLSLYPAHTRLPSIRDIAGVLDTSIVTIQRALTELVNEGVLYSKERSGIFVAPPRSADGQAGGAPASTAPDNLFLSRFHFGTDSTAPYQQAFWQHLASDFQAGHPTTEPVLNFTPDSPDFSTKLDLFERSAWSRQWATDQTPLLDLTHFATEELTPLSRSGLSLPLYHRTYFLFYNRTLLEKHGIPLPGYRDFASQTGYFRTVAPQIAALGLDPRPYSIQEPVTLLGREIERFFDLTRAPEIDPAEVARLVTTVDALIAFCQQCRRGDDGNSSWREERSRFLRGEIPFFLGYSVDYWEFHSRENGFDLATYPTLCADNALFLSPIVGAINQRSVHPAESLRFMSFIRSRPVQESLAAIGNFGGDITAGIAPATTGDAQWILGLLPRSYPFELTAPDSFYLAINILNGEIWRSMLDFTSTEDSIMRALNLARSYLRHRAARAAIV